MQDKWESVRNRCSGFDYSNVIEQAFELVKKGSAPRPALGYWEEDDSSSDSERLLRLHFSHTGGDSGIANQFPHDSQRLMKVLNEVNEVLGLTFDLLVDRISSKNYDARDITVEGLYNWRAFFHNGSEFEAIHIAILMFGDDNLRTDWSMVLSEAFTIKRQKRED